MKQVGAGLKWTAIVALVLVVGWTSWKTVQYIQQVERDKIIQEIEKQVKDDRKIIRDAIESSQPADSDDATDSLRYLEDRNSNR